jgi:hypothetical protein
LGVKYLLSIFHAISILLSWTSLLERSTASAKLALHHNKPRNMIDKSFFILELLVKQADNMEMAMWLDYKPTRYEGKGFLHRDITG